MPKHTIEAIVNPNVAPTAIGQHWINTATKRHWLSAGDSLVGDWIEQTESTALSDGDRGDITVSADGATWTVDNSAISLAKMANLATQRFIGRTTAGTGAPEALTPGQATAILDTFTSSLKGLAPLSGGGTTNFLRADGTWAVPAGGAGVSDGDKGDITVSASGATWTIDNSVVTTAKLGGDITTAGKAILDDADASAQRTTLGLGTAATTASSAYATASHSHSAADITSGTLAVAQGGTGVTASTGSVAVVLSTSPTLVTPTIGVATATSINKVAITAPATSATLTVADGKTLTSSNTLTFAGTDGSTLNVGTGGTLGTAAYTATTAYAAASHAHATSDITSGTLGVDRGGTGIATATTYAVLCGGTTGTGAFQSIASVGTSGQVLTSNGAGALPTFQAPTGGGGSSVGSNVFMQRSFY